MENLNEHVRLWVEALRSGLYQKCEGHLRQFNADGSFSYCALGVAIKVAQDHGIEINDDLYDEDILPESVVAWLGAKPYSRELELNAHTVLDHNDGEFGWEINPEKIQPKTFKLIADVIESHPQAFGKPRVYDPTTGEEHEI